MSKIKIVPTVMPYSYDDFVSKIEFIRSCVSLVQIDVMDGNFVSSKSWPYNGTDQDQWQILKNQEDGIPYWEVLDFEVDLMVRNSLLEAEHWIDAGATRVIGHIESLKMDSQVESFIDLKNSRGVEVYLALSPDTPLLEIQPYLSLIDGVQFMGIKKVGFQGQPFESGILDKMKELKIIMPEIQISVDGGVNYDTASDLVKAGADELCSGSLIFESANPKEVINSLEKIIYE
jgi:ribulose-phosphate 3-epimerase